MCSRVLAFIAFSVILLICISENGSEAAPARHYKEVMVQPIEVDNSNVGHVKTGSLNLKIGNGIDQNLINMLLKMLSQWLHWFCVSNWKTVEIRVKLDFYGFARKKNRLLWINID